MKNKTKESGTEVLWWHSVFTKLFMLMMVTVVLIVGCYVVVNTTLLEKYYVKSKERALIDVFSVVSKICGEESISEDERRVRFEKLCSDYNMQLMLFSQSGEAEYSSLPIDAVRFRGNPTEQGENRKSAPPPGRHDKEILSETDKYTITSEYIERLDSRIIELHGKPGGGRSLLLQVSATSIKESVTITNKFLIWCGFFAMTAAVFVATVLSHKAAKKIRVIAEAANRMADLDFSAKYEDGGSDEISHLGNSLNTLSLKLERSISELKKANLQLMKDIDQKEKIDKQRREFLSNVSHELKTPIAIIEAYAEGLNEMELDEDSRRFYSDVILDEAEKMSKLISKLMALMRIESGSEILDIERYDITEQIGRIIEQKQILIEQCGAKTEFSQTESVYVWADEFLIEEVFVNFLVNAAKYSSGDKLIRVYIERKGKKVRVCVYNRGNGICSEDMNNIWRSFYRADKARNRESSSCGLGLSVVSAIIDAHGQNCGVYNETDGVVFWFEVDGEE